MRCKYYYTASEVFQKKDSGEGLEEDVLSNADLIEGKRNSQKESISWQDNRIRLAFSLPTQTLLRSVSFMFLNGFCLVEKSNILMVFSQAKRIS